MNLTSTIIRQVVAVETNAAQCLASLISFAESLNRAHKHFWDKPDDELQPFLQAFLDNGKLQSIFVDHEFYAASTNQMLTRYGANPICVTGVRRPFTVDDGTIVLAPIPEPSES